MEDKKHVNPVRLFWTMFKIGAFTFGGGYAMVPLIEAEFVKKNNYLKQQEMADILAISQSLPGAIAINASVICGYKVSGISGAVLSVLGMVLPSLISLTVVTYLYEWFKDNAYVAGALKGIRAAVVALLISAFLSLSKPFRKQLLGILICAAAFLISFLWDINSIYIILGALALGIAYSLIRRQKHA